MRLLLHICCAGCAIYPLEVLIGRGLRPTGLWFNPNIYPHEEFALRRETLDRFSSMRGVDVLYDEAWGGEELMRALDAHTPLRCELCYRTRLRASAQRARDMGLDAFTTTLLVSPYQRQDLIRAEGLAAQEEFSVEFLFEDFREGFGRAARTARELGLYRQNYCGCAMSLEERGLRRAGESEALRSKYMQGLN